MFFKNFTIQFDVIETYFWLADLLNIKEIWYQYNIEIPTAFIRRTLQRNFDTREIFPGAIPINYIK